MKYILVAGLLWETWLEKQPERWRSIENGLGHLNFFGKRYDERFELTAATCRGGKQVVGVAVFCATGKSLRSRLEVHELVAIGVDEDFRGRGVGRRLLCRFARRPASNLSGAVVVRNWFSDAVGFYERIGFHRRKTQTRESREWMEGADAGVLFWRYR